MSSLQLYEKDLFGLAVRPTMDDGRPRCLHAVARRDGATGFDQCKRAGAIHLPGAVWVCVVHDPRAANARARAKAVKAAAEQRRENLAFAAPRLLRALAAIRDGADDPVTIATKAIGNLEL